MKPFYTAVLAILFSFSAGATTWPVAVSNFQFSPATVNAVVGDIIEFTWTSGTHTTTCGSGLPGTTLPAGATPWDAPITSGVTTFSYTVTVVGNYFYGCTPHFEGGLGMVGNIVVSGPLPVKFGAFNVRNDNDIALLQWETLAESNTSHFPVRKSTDGTHFSEIGKINAAGNSEVTRSYQFSDNDLGEIYKYLYYEIVTVDFDTKESHSAIRSLRNGRILKENIIVALSPNPATRPGQVKVLFNADKAGTMDVAVFNMGGQRVLKTTMAAFPGINSAHLHICDLERGNYNIVFTMDGKKEIKKVAVL